MQNSVPLNFTEKFEILYDYENKSKIYNPRNLRELCAISIGTKLGKIYFENDLDNFDRKTIIAGIKYFRDFYLSIDCLYNEHCSKTLKETLKSEINKYLTQDSNYNLSIVEYKALSKFVWIALCRNIAAKFYKYVVYRHEQDWDEEPEPKNYLKFLDEISESYSHNLTSTLYQLNCILKISNINNINSNQHGLLPSKFVFHVSNKILRNFETLCWNQINNLDKSSIFTLCKCLQIVYFAAKLAKRSKSDIEEAEYEINSDEIQSLIEKVIDYMMFNPYSVFDNYQTTIGSILDRITKYFEP